jgi:predicted adenine nucleotide alpha hydrolase (AANH) superfamily ATPase
LISRGDFVFTIGYEGNTAVVDGAMKKRHGSLSTIELAEKQLYKQAVCSAVYEEATQQDGDPGEEALQRVLEIYNKDTARKIGSVEQLQRTFGVYEVPEGIGKVMVI